MKQARKIAACTMAATMLVSSVMASGCSKKPKGSNEKIADDAPWYELETVMLGEQYKDDDSIEYVYTNFIGQFDDRLVYYTSGSYKMPDDVDMSTVNFSDYNIDNVDLYDADGNLIKSIDIRSVIDESGLYAYDPEAGDADASASDEASAEDTEDAADDADADADADAADDDIVADDADVSDDDTSDEEDIITIDGLEDMPDNAVYFSDEDYVPQPWWYVNDYRIKDGVAEIYISGGVPTTGFDEELIDSVFTFDLATGDLISYEETTIEESEDDLSQEGSYSFDGYTVAKFWIYDPSGNYSYVLDVTDPDGNTTSYDLRESIPGTVIYDIQGMLYLGDHQVLFTFYGEDYDTVSAYTMDLDTGAVAEYDGDTAWFENDMYNAVYMDDIGNVAVDHSGIKLLDFDSQSKTQIFSFDSCNINRADAQSLTLISMTDDKIILSGTLYRGNGFSYSGNSIDTELFILERAETNPHAGKTVLVASTLTGFDYTLCEAVCNYNDTNPDYFIRLDTKYSIMDKYLNGEIDFDSEDADQQELDAEAELSNQLMIDLLAGEGPDIILGGANYYQLNNEDYLIDLANEVDTSGLFANVIDASKVDDKLYQMPLTVGVGGIITDKSNVDDSQFGFTFDQYSDFVSDVCNGQDPVGVSQLDFFMYCLNCITNDCMVDGKASYDNDAFRSLAEFTNENVTDQLMDEEGNMYYSGVDLQESGAFYSSNTSFSSIINQFPGKLNDLKILGLPTVDGRGPVINVLSSAAVSAQTNEKDACVAFINTLISEDIQTDYGRYDYCTPIRISSFETSAQEGIELYNQSVEENLRWYSEEEIIMYDINTETLDDSSIASFEEMIESCSQISSMDPAVASIVVEEMGAYFSGQKSLDDVIEVMEDRVQTFINERG